MESVAGYAETVITLKNNRDVLIREMRPDDFERSYEFFRELPSEDRMYLRHDVTRRDIVQRRIKDMEYGRVRRLVAIAGDENDDVDVRREPHAGLIVATDDGVTVALDVVMTEELRPYGFEIELHSRTRDGNHDVAGVINREARAKYLLE